ncbi:hypothetical protein M427DRAFT_35814 [Gonapodya prolifera JEL478]|uniref:Xylanolytic transcriptional activator regulatory domain-containing protein n=1 Tax=Gonapodya prolifera (strain JEL478) TaxID=1344416 RepID=A0A139A3P2_GONPJ|nr:hypothetical protein M427DRAFT_35814 [Gonapodya prolifera JEL478]|eukprot:KXS11437.1 hypothetical protein M427DRAFT_35814 [Gonapodya prolifera JEL478]
MPQNVANDVSFIQALLLMIQHTAGFDISLARQFVELATSKSRQLMLLTDPSMLPNHRIQELPGSTGWVKDEERRRTGWALFGADRIGSFVNNSPALLSDEELKLQPPASEELWGSNPSSSTSSSHAFASSVASLGPLEPLYIVGQAETLRSRDWSEDNLVVT